MSDKKNSKVVAGSSIGFGTILAIVLSWTANKSIIWAIIHGLFNWLYVIYYLFTHEDWTWF